LQSETGAGSGLNSRFLSSHSRGRMAAAQDQNLASPRSDTSAIVEIRDVDYPIGDRTICSGLSLALPRGGITATMGPSGTFTTVRNRSRKRREEPLSVTAHEGPNGGSSRSGHRSPRVGSGADCRDSRGRFSARESPDFFGLAPLDSARWRHADHGTERDGQD